MKRPTAAVADCDLALEISNSCAKAHKVHASALVQLGQWAEALSSITSGNRIDPDSASLSLQARLEAKVERWTRKNAREEAAAKSKLLAREKEMLLTSFSLLLTTH